VKKILHIATLFILCFSLIACLTTESDIDVESVALSGSSTVGVLKLNSVVEVPESAKAIDKNIEGAGPPEFYVPGQNIPISVKFSPGGKFLLTANAGGSITLYSVNPFEEIRSNGGGFGVFLKTSFSQDGKYIYAQGQKAIFCWETDSGKLITTIKPPLEGVNSMITSFSVIDDNRTLLISSISEIFVWDIPSNTIRNRIETHSQKIASIPGTKQYVTYTILGILECWDWERGEKNWSLETADPMKHESIKDLKLSRDGQTVYVLSSQVDLSDPKNPLMAQNAKILWADSTSGKNRASLSLGNNIVSFLPHPDGRYLFIGDNSHHINLIDLQNSKVISKYDTLSTADTAMREAYKDIPALTLPMAISPDGKTLFWGGFNTGIWDLTKSELKGRPAMDSAIEISNSYLNGDGSILMVGLQAWDTFRGFVIPDTPDIEWNTSLSTEMITNGYGLISTDGTMQVKKDYQNPELQLIDTGTNKVLHILKGHKSAGITWAVFTKNNKLLATAGTDNTIRLWNTSTGKNLREIPSRAGLAFSVIFSPDEQRIYVSTTNGVYIYRVEDGAYLGRFISTKNNGWISFSASGYFNGNEEGMKNMRARMGNKVLPLESFYDQFYNPLEVAAAFFDDSRPLSEQPKLNIAQISAPPPEVQLLLETSEGLFKDTQMLEEKDLSIISNMVKIRVIAEDSGGGVGDILVRNNGKILEEYVRGLTRKKDGSLITQEFTVPLANGQNVISVAALSTQRIESAPVRVVVSYAPTKLQVPNMYVLAIGIDEYRNKRYNLNYAVGDVNGFLQSLNDIADTLYNEIHTTVILNSEATKNNIENQFNEIASRAMPEDVFVFYYAGHGIALSDLESNKKNEFYYVLHNVTQMTNTETIIDTGISGSEVREYFTKIPAMKQIALIDACNSGAFAESFAYRGAAEEEALGKLSRATGSAIIAATRDDQFASELSVLGHGAFTMAVIEAFEGAAAGMNSQITASSLRLYLDDRLPKITAEFTGSEQFPISFMFGQDFPIGLK
jgi:WD40 repeat protein